MDKGINISDVLATIGELTLKDRQATQHIEFLEKSFSDLKTHHEGLLAALAMCDFVRWIHHQLIPKRLSVVA